MTKATDIELALYRSRLLRSSITPHHFTEACKIIARHASIIARHQINACNGIDRWDAKLQRLIASWTEEDREVADAQTAKGRKVIAEALKPFLTPGCKWDWKTDPRAGSVLRITDKSNSRDVWI